MGTVKIAPSMLAADFANLERDINMVNQSEADWFHLECPCLKPWHNTPKKHWMYI